MRNYKQTIAWLLIVPTIALFYIGLFLTMKLWYPAGLPLNSWYMHIINFTIIYALWFIIFFSYRLFDWDTIQTVRAIFGRLFGALTVALIVAALYFYFQPALLITPRRFLLVHIFISGLGIILWYLIIRQAVSRNRHREVYVHSTHTTPEDVKILIDNHQMLGLKFSGVFQPQDSFSAGSLVVVPNHAEINEQDSKALFGLRNQGIRFIEYHELYEGLTRTVHLSVLSDLWFIHSIDYGAHQLFDIFKRLIDIFFGLIGTIVFLISFPIIGILTKLTLRGSIIFSQPRVGQNGQIFILYKYRTMDSSAATDTWTAQDDQRITKFGKLLRSLRMDEFPQSLNILRGDMSIVGPRPEQVNIVQQLEQQIPYYNERHIVKPGLTGWAQLHVYAGSLEESRKKLQYDLYYIKHRSLLFDAEIILKTFYSVITFSGR